MKTKLMKSERGITVVEFAILLVAFVVVAAIFAFTVLTAGSFITERAATVTPLPAQSAPAQSAPPAKICLPGWDGNTRDVKMAAFSISAVLFMYTVPSSPSPGLRVKVVGGLPSNVSDLEGGDCK